MDDRIIAVPENKEPGKLNEVINEQAAIGVGGWFKQFIPQFKTPSLEKSLPSVENALPSLSVEKPADSDKAKDLAPPVVVPSKETVSAPDNTKNISKAPVPDSNTDSKKELSLPGLARLTPNNLKNGADIAFGGIDFDQNGQLDSKELMRNLKYSFEGQTPEMKAIASLMNKHYEAFRMMDGKAGISLPGIHKIERLGTLPELPQDSPLYFHAKKGAYFGGASGMVLGAIPSYGIGRLAFNMAASARPGLAPLVAISAAVATEIAVTAIGAGIGYKQGRKSDNADYENGQKAKLKSLMYDLNVNPGLIKG